MMYEIYLKTDAFQRTSELVAFNESDSRKAIYTDGSFIYEFLDYYDEDEVFYTIVDDNDADGKFLSFTEDLLYDDKDEAIEGARDFDNASVVGWYVRNGEVIAE